MHFVLQTAIINTLEIEEINSLWQYWWRSVEQLGIDRLIRQARKTINAAQLLTSTSFATCIGVSLNGVSF